MSKRFYWMKLKENFMTSDTVDFLMSQPNGAEYVVLYQMLCLQTLNTDGVLGRTIGEVMIPYDAAKIQRDCKYFSIDTVTLALGYYKKLGLVFELDNGFLKIANYENIIGSETDSAERVRRHRALKASENDEKTGVLQGNARCNENVTIEIEIRDRELVKDIKEKLSRAGAYTGVHDALVDEVVDTLCGLHEGQTLKFDGVTYSAEDFQQMAQLLEVEDVCKVVNSLLAHRNEIKNRKYYILATVAGVMRGDRDEQ